MEVDLTCIILSCIYNANLVAEIGIKYAKFERVLLCKAGFPFPWSRNVFQRIFVRSVATGNANANDCRSITILFGKRLHSNIYH